MRLWLREIAGWLLLGLSLWIFFYSFDLLSANKYFQAGPYVLIGIFVFRGGIQLLKVAVAARVCAQAQEQLTAEKQAPATASPRAVRGRTTARW